MLKLFVSYSHKDEILKEDLETHLSLLKRQNLVDYWSDRKILPGDNWEIKINNELEKADVILLLISSDFIASDYCYNNEVKKAVEMHNNGSKTVVPIILRDCDWQDTPFGKIQGLPKDAKPVLSKFWHNKDEAFLDIAKKIKEIIYKIIKDKEAKKLNKEEQKTTKVVTFDFEHEFVSLNNNPYKYIGQVQNSVPHGFGKAEFENGDEYLGHWENGKISGRGIYSWKEGLTYAGEWVNHEKSGIGVEFSSIKNDFTFGKFKNDQLFERLKYNYNLEACSFCSTEKKDVSILIAGHNALICDSCIEQAKLLKDIELKPEKAKKPKA